MKPFIAIAFVIVAVFAFANDYSTNVVRKSNGDVYIQGIRPKVQTENTCYVTSLGMILDYYGISYPERYILQKKFTGTLKQYMQNSGISEHIWMQKNIQAYKTFIKSSIDAGLPLCWVVDLRLAPITDIPRKTKATKYKKNETAYHARLITGYTKKGNQITKIFYSDSWGGEKNINKIMSVQSAFKMTDKTPTTSGAFALSVFLPPDLDPEIKEKLLAELPSIPGGNRPRKSSDQSTTATAAGTDQTARKTATAANATGTTARTNQTNRRAITNQPVRKTTAAAKSKPPYLNQYSAEVNRMADEILAREEAEKKARRARIRANQASR